MLNIEDMLYSKLKPTSRWELRSGWDLRWGSDRTVVIVAVQDHLVLTRHPSLLLGRRLVLAPVVVLLEIPLLIPRVLIIHLRVVLLIILIEVLRLRIIVHFNLFILVSFPVSLVIESVHVTINDVVRAVLPGSFGQVFVVIDEVSHLSRHHLLQLLQVLAHGHLGRKIARVQVVYFLRR